MHVFLQFCKDNHCASRLAFQKFIFYGLFCIKNLSPVWLHEQKQSKLNCKDLQGDRSSNGDSSRVDNTTAVKETEPETLLSAQYSSNNRMEAQVV